MYNQLFATIQRYKFEAIHNKDYSVVKTSRAAFVALFCCRGERMVCETFCNFTNYWHNHHIVRKSSILYR